MFNESESQNIRAYRVRWLLPMTTPPIENGIIIIDDEKIRAIGAYEDFQGEIPEPLIDLEDTIVFPAFINVHTHLEEDVTSGPVSNFYQYLTYSTITRQKQTEEQRNALVQANIIESKRFGTIALGDFSTDGLSVNLLQEEPVFARIFHKVSGFKNYEADAIFRDKRDQIAHFGPTKRLTSHLGASSVWEVSQNLFQNIGINERHIAIHLSMSEDELEFLRTGHGPAKQFLLAKDDFDYTWKPPRMTPVQYFFNNRYYARHNILVHMNILSNTDIEIIKATPAKVNVCLCVRSSKNLNLQPTPVKQILDKGVNICMGTESKTLSGDLDMRKEINECIQQSGINPETALKFATLNGAYAIGFHKEVGSLDVGKTSHCLAIRTLNSDLNDPYSAVLDMSQEVHWLGDLGNY